jgi:selenocysteine lyase/cysteine desulfurase
MNTQTDLAAFQRAHPAYDAPAVDALRAAEYGRLDAEGHVYLDYTGGGLYAESQLRQHLSLLQRGVYGNPHSTNPTSGAATALAEEARDTVLDYFRASPDEYACIFTANASGALKLVGEAYPFAPGSTFLLTADNHNSVNGIREFARARGARHSYLPLTAPDLSVPRTNVLSALEALPPRGAPVGRPGLFAFPAQSNFSGAQHPLDWIAAAQARGWDVLLDVAAFAPTNRLDLSRWHPDFVALSFYKLFGYPTGVGCLLARRKALARMRRPWYAGGTVVFSSVQGDGHLLHQGPPAFEDGTINYLSLPAITIGLRYLAGVDVETVHARVRCLSGWLLDQLRALRHGNGAPLVRLYGPAQNEGRGGTVAFNLLTADGAVVDCAQVEARANLERISLRTGCFCNPGASEAAFGLTAAELAPIFRLPASQQEHSHRQLLAERRMTLGAVRASLGVASTFADVHRFLGFLRRFADVPTGVRAAQDALPV